MFFVHIFSRMSEDFLYNTPRKTISALKDCFEVKVIDIKLKHDFSYEQFLIFIYFQIIGYLFCSFWYHETRCRWWGMVVYCLHMQQVSVPWLKMFFFLKKMQQTCHKCRFKVIFVPLIFQFYFVFLFDTLYILTIFLGVVSRLVLLIKQIQPLLWFLIGMLLSFSASHVLICLKHTRRSFKFIVTFVILIRGTSYMLDCCFISNIHHCNFVL